MTYAVLTAKHHDGYCLWPSEYGSMSTANHMGGRDLMRPFVEACRKAKIKVGFYFSGPDWSYPGYPVSLDNSQQPETPLGAAGFENATYARFVHGQLSELLTRYGDLDLIWFDGGIGGVADFGKSCAWIRQIQPHIVIGRHGDIAHSFEAGHKPLAPPEGWWERVMYLGGHWGHAPATDIEPAYLIIDKLVSSRAWNGNFLMNLGPKPDGTMRPEYYERLREVGEWMKHSRELLIGAQGVRNWQNFSAVPVTRRGNTWYLHVLPSLFGPIQMYDIGERPKAVTLLRSGESLRYRYYSKRLVVDLPYAKREKLDEVIQIAYDRQPNPTRERY